jgi:hypothetical protein
LASHEFSLQSRDSSFQRFDLVTLALPQFVVSSERAVRRFVRFEALAKDIELFSIRVNDETESVIEFLGPGETGSERSLLGLEGIAFRNEQEKLFANVLSTRIDNGSSVEEERKRRTSSRGTYVVGGRDSLDFG